MASNDTSKYQLLSRGELKSTFIQYGIKFKDLYRALKDINKHCSTKRSVRNNDQRRYRFAIGANKFKLFINSIRFCATVFVERRNQPFDWDTFALSHFHILQGLNWKRVRNFSKSLKRNFDKLKCLHPLLAPLERPSRDASHEDHANEEEEGGQNHDHHDHDVAVEVEEHHDASLTLLSNKRPPLQGGPPPPPRGLKRAKTGLTRCPEVIAKFQEMQKVSLGNPATCGGGASDPGALMDELLKNSKYIAQVQADIKNYGALIQDLITQVSIFEPKDMPEMIEFVGRVDGVLSKLSDATAVLKKFDWPQRYYTMLEAKGLYTELEKMKETFSPWKKTENKAVAEMEKIQKFMDKSRTRMDVIMMTKDSDEKRFKDNRIPWNAKIFTEVKIASLSALIAYMEVVLEEVNLLMSAAPAEQGPMRKKALDKSLEHLNGTITLAFKVHQFTGGYTEECNSKFAEVSTKIAEIRGEISAMAS